VSAAAAPVGELDSIPILARNLAEQIADDDAPGGSSDLLCSKGAAVATRGRSYDHKDAFEPAQGATAPPSDIDVFGSWLKYEGSLPVPTDHAQAVLDEERPTSWSKYEAKPMASLLESIEKPRSKPRVLQLESAQAAAFAPSKSPAVSEAAPEPSDVQTEAVAAEPIAVIETLPDPVVVPTPAVATAASEPQPETASSAIEEDPAATCDTATPPSPPPDPEIPMLHLAIVAPQEGPHDPVSRERHESPASPLVEASASPAETPSTVAAPMEEEPRPAPIAQFPTIESGTDEPPQDEPSVAPDNLAVPPAVPSVEQPAPMDALDGESAALVSAAGAPIEEAGIAWHEEATAPTVGASSSAKKAMLARLAEMLERALSAKRAGGFVSQDLPPAVASDKCKTAAAPSDVFAPEPGPAPSPDFIPETLVAQTNETETIVPVSMPEAHTTEHTTEPQPILGPPQETAAEIVESPEEPGEPERPETEAETAIAAVTFPPSIEAATAEIAAARIETEEDASVLEARADDGASESKSASINATATHAARPALNTPSGRLVKMLSWALSKRSADEFVEIADTTDLERSATTAPSEEALSPETAAPLHAPAVPGHEPAEILVANAETIDLEEPEPEATIAPAETGSQPETRLGPPSDECALSEVTPVPEIEPTVVDFTSPPIDQVASLAQAATPPTDIPVTTEPSHEMFVSPPEASYAEVTAGSLAAVSLPEGVVDEPAPAEPAADAPADQALSTETIDVGENENQTTAEDKAPPAPPDASITPVQEPVAEAFAIPPDVDAAPQAAQEPATFAPEAIATEAEPAPVSPDVSMVALVAGTGPVLVSETAELIAAEVASAAPPPVEVAAIIEAAPIVAPPPTVAPPSPAPPTRAQQEKVAREALTHDLADVIRNVLSTTQFATKALKPVRYSAEEPVEGLTASDFAEDLTATLPHPVVVRSRFGRMERTLALASVAMLAMVGYFAFSLWHGEVAGPAKAAAITVATPASDDWGERARDMTRELGSIATVTDAPTVDRSEPPVSKPASPPHGPRIAQ